jgi:serine/threonine protein kinase
MADGDEGWQLVDYSAEGHDRRQIREWGQTAGNWSGYGRHVTSKDIRWKLREGEMLGYGGTGLVEQVTYRSVMMARKKIRAARNVSVEKIKEEGNIMEILVHRHIVELVGTYVRGQSELNILMYPAAVTDLDQFLSDIKNLRLGTSSVFGDISRRFDQLGFKGIYLNTDRDKIDEFLEGPLRFLASILGCITEAVLYMHMQQVRHQDITPKNILLSRQQVFLADFGSSKLLENDSDLLTDGFGIGTPIFLAPEVVERKGHHMAPADIYSLGCVFLFVATALYGASHIQLEKATSHRQNPKEKTLEIGKYIDNLRYLAAAKGKAHENELTCMPKHILAMTQAMLSHDPSTRPTIEQVHKTMYKIGGIDQIYHGKCCKKDGVYISKIIGQF